MPLATNPEVTRQIVYNDFFEALENAQTQRFYPRLSVEKSVSDITTVFPSFGSVPEPIQTGGAVGMGPDPATILKDWKATATVYPWRQTILFDRLTAESKPAEMSEKSRQMAFKAMKGMDKALVQALTNTTVLGYDNKALFSTTHNETGSNQDNAINVNIGTPTAPTGAEVETALTTAVSALKGFQDDQGTPVNEGITKVIALIPETFEWAFRTVVSPLMSNQAVDSSGGTGRFRGIVDVIVSAYASDNGTTSGNKDVFWLFADPSESMARALALAKLLDWQFNSNIGDESSDQWNKGEAYQNSYAAHAYVPWNWQAAIQVTFT
jgi:hypothetical protein